MGGSLGSTLHHFARLDAVVADNTVGRTMQHRPGEFEFKGLNPRLRFLVPRLQDLQTLLAQIGEAPLVARQVQGRAMFFHPRRGALGVPFVHPDHFRRVPRRVVLLRLPDLFLSHRHSRLFTFVSHERGVQLLLRHDAFVKQAAGPPQRQFRFSQGGLPAPAGVPGRLPGRPAVRRPSWRCGRAARQATRVPARPLVGWSPAAASARSTLSPACSMVSGSSRRSSSTCCAMPSAMACAWRNSVSTVLLVQANQHLPLAYRVALRDQNLQQPERSRPA